LLGLPVVSAKGHSVSARRAPIAIVAAVAALLCLLQALPHFTPTFDFLQRLEWIWYDRHVRQAFNQGARAADNLGFVCLDDDSLKMVSDNFGYIWPWPRQLYGRLIGELTAQGAKAIAIDILFLERQPIQGTEILVDGQTVESDDYFAQQLGRCSNVVLAAPCEQVGLQRRMLMPESMFRTNAWRVGHVASEVDADAVLRRAKPFYDDPQHGRIWHTGILLAARELGLDLEHASVTPDEIRLRGTHGINRVIPLDREGYFHIDWSLPPNDRRLLQDRFESLLQQDILRSNGKTNLPAVWRNKLVVVGSTGTGNNISDIGATPLSQRTFLISTHWNVANSIITNQLIRRGGYLTETGLLFLLCATAAVLAWRFRVLLASGLVVAVLVEYFALGSFLYERHRYWLPLVQPSLGLLLTYVCLVIHRVVVEQRERHRVRSIFSKVVSPNVVTELLKTEQFSLGGARRKVTVFFADVRGFTRVTDEIQARAEQHVQDRALPPLEAEAYLDAQARDILSTVNLYLGVIADTIKLHNGTLDKYIGDCVMAFWGAPAASERQALDGVRAAIDSQRAIYALNLRRAAENQRRERENQVRAAAGLPPLPLLTLLALGTGINTGTVTVGLMGSDAHIVNYTVFGRDVNLASRLEGISGRGRIVISETTYQDLQRLSPELAEVCEELPPVEVKGIREALRIYEVHWRQAASESVAYDTSILTGAEPTLPTDFLDHDPR
jgi:class 3 adenylate cyclase